MDRVEIKTRLLESSICYQPSNRLALEQTHEVRYGQRLGHTSPVYVAKGRGTLIPTPRHMAGFMTLHKKRA